MSREMPSDSDPVDEPEFENESLGRIDGYVFRTDRDGTRGLIVDSERLDACVEYINRKGITRVETNDYLSYRRDDVDFLRECPSVECVRLVSHVGDLSGLHALSGLRELWISEPGKAAVDFGRFPELRKFRGDWSRKYSGFESCRKLSRLALWKYKPKSKDLTGLACFQRLVSLELVQGSVTALVGIERLRRLQRLELSYLRTLVDIEALREAPRTLRVLRFDRCPNIGSFDAVSSLEQLEELGLSGCREIESLEIVRPLRRLRHVSFVDTTIRDGDLSVLFDLPALGHAGFFNKTHYSHTWKQIEAHVQRSRRSA